MRSRRAIFLHRTSVRIPGHFTQVIWRSTKQLGCGVALCKGSHFWVCRYLPSGNVEGRYRQNIPKPC